MITFAASIPIIVLMVMLGVFRISGAISAVVTLIVTVVLALLVFHCSVDTAAKAFTLGLLKAFSPILLIVLAAMFSYNILVKTQYIETLKMIFTTISADKKIQVMLIVWGFGGLLGAMSGFGTATAIPASILISLGYNPIFACTISLVADSVPTAFGGVGIPVITLAKETDIDWKILSTNIVSQLAVIHAVWCTVTLFLIDKTLAKWKENLIFGTIVGGSSLLGQWVGAQYLGVEFPAITGTIGIIVSVLIYAKITKPKAEPQHSARLRLPIREQYKALSVYIFMLVFIFLTSDFFFKKSLENLLVSHFSFDMGQEKGTVTFSIHQLTNTGIVTLLGAFLGGLTQGLRIRDLLSLLIKTAYKLNKTMITVTALFGLSSIMAYSNMTGNIANGIAAMTGALYPFFAPIIGYIGCFITGSDTSSNVLFGKLQVEVAQALDIDPAWTAASNTSGATAGKIISPQSISVATSATNQVGKESVVLRKTLPLTVGYALIVSLISGLFSR